MEKETIEFWFDFRIYIVRLYTALPANLFRHCKMPSSVIREEKSWLLIYSTFLREEGRQ